MMLSKLFAPLVVVDVSGRSAPDRSRPILSRVLDATDHRGSSIKLVRSKQTRSRLNSERLTYSLPLILASQLSPSISRASPAPPLTLAPVPACSPLPVPALPSISLLPSAPFVTRLF